MEIWWLGHSCVRIRSSDTTLISDPYSDSIGLSLGPQSAEVVTVSHPHPHHSQSEVVGGSPRVVSGPGEYEIGDFYITGMGTSRRHDDKAINTVFRIQAEEMTLCHVGDLNATLPSRQVDELRATDVMFVPVGGVCTLDTHQIVELVKLVAPKIVIPIHFGVEGVDLELGPLDDFLIGMGVSHPDQQPKLSVTSTSLPRDTQLVVLGKAA